ncbi:MAG: hypothetical protein P1U64_04620 [Alcanivoracaceae bacterium]|nr:hypothetical protein [Alcanivoracaceae bacterium]
MTTRNQAADAVAPLAQVSRRRFVKTALWGTGAVLALAGGSFAILRRSPLDDVSKPASLVHLSAPEYHLFNRAIEVLLPIDDGGLTPVDQVPVMANIDHTMGLVDPAVREDIRIGLALFDNAAVVAGLHGRRFVDLDRVDAIAYFDSWSRGNVLQKALQTVVKKFVYVSYWRDPATWPPVEFDGPVSDRWGIAYLGNAPLPDESTSDTASGEARA